MLPLHRGHRGGGARGCGPACDRETRASELPGAEAAASLDSEGRAIDTDNLKGLGGAFVREKVVAGAARRFVLIVDESKMVLRLGTRSPVLVEVIPFAASFVSRRLQDLEPRPRMRDGGPFISDNGNAVLELH